MDETKRRYQVPKEHSSLALVRRIELWDQPRWCPIYDALFERIISALEELEPSSQLKVRPS
jgi:hypothetical protein